MGAARPFRTSPKCGATRIAKPLLFEDDRHRPVVDEFDRHASAEDTGLDGDALRAQRGAEAVIERFRGLRRRGLAEARSVPLARIGDERELADNERRAADVEEAAVEPAALVFEQAQPRDLCSEAFRGG